MWFKSQLIIHYRDAYLYVLFKHNRQSAVSDDVIILTYPTKVSRRHGAQFVHIVAINNSLLLRYKEF